MNATWEWLEMIAPCVEVLRQLARNFNDILGADQGTRHAPPDLTKDIDMLMSSLNEHKVYQIQKGRVLDEDDGPVKDVVAVGLQNLTEGTKNPLSEYNDAFKRLQRRRRMKVVSHMHQDGSNASRAVDPEGTTKSTGSRSSLQDDSRSPPPSNPDGDNDSDASDEDQEITEDAQIMGDLFEKVVEPTLPRLSEEDVALDMDEVIFEDEGAMSDGTVDSDYNETSDEEWEEEGI